MDINEAINVFVGKAKNAKNSDEALKYSQAALTLAHTLATMANAKVSKPMVKQN